MVHSQKVQEIAVTVDKELLGHEHFSFCQADIPAIVERINRGTSFVGGFHTTSEPQKILFSAVFDIEPDGLHIRQVGGAFAKYQAALAFFAETIAARLDLPEVTFNTIKPAVKKWAEKQGYKYISADMYGKTIH